MRSQLTTRRRVTAGLVGATLLLAACGGDADSGDTLPRVDSAESGGSEPDVDAASPTAVGTGIVDLVGPELTADADFEGNPLPDVIVDDLNNGRKVNFKNLVPQEKPILLWMWAPH